MRYFSGDSIEGEGGSTIDLNSDFGWGFGFGYNLNEKFNLGFEFTWLDTNYEATIQSGETPALPAVTVGGTLEASTGNFNVQYNILDRVVTPFIGGGIGWTYIDSNIPTGPDETYCWWDPWYGYICSSWQPTAADTSLSYGLSGGVRGELGEAFYLELAYTKFWIDFDNAGSTDLDGYRFDMGWKF
jgi:opacity protein-like surface antigen